MEEGEEIIGEVVGMEMVEGVIAEEEEAVVMEEEEEEEEEVVTEEEEEGVELVITFCYYKLNTVRLREEDFELTPVESLSEEITF